MRWTEARILIHFIDIQTNNIICWNWKRYKTNYSKLHSDTTKQWSDRAESCIAFNNVLKLCMYHQGRVCVKSLQWTWLCPQVHRAHWTSLTWNKEKRFTFKLLFPNNIPGWRLGSHWCVKLSVCCVMDALALTEECATGRMRRKLVFRDHKDFCQMMKTNRFFRSVTLDHGAETSTEHRSTRRNRTIPVQTQVLTTLVY